MFDPRDSAYAVNLTYDRHTYIPTYIYHAKSRLNIINKKKSGAMYQTVNKFTLERRIILFLKKKAQCSNLRVSVKSMQI